MTWVYIQTEAGVWTVGFYDPNGNWHAESDWPNPEQAAERVRYLNGGATTQQIPQGTSSLSSTATDIERMLKRFVDRCDRFAKQVDELTERCHRLTEQLRQFLAGGGEGNGKVSCLW